MIAALLIALAVLAFACMFLALQLEGNTAITFDSNKPIPSKSDKVQALPVHGKQSAVRKSPLKSTGKVSSLNTCHFRKYPPHRYYGKNEAKLPDFLTKTEYIYGEYPTMLELGERVVSTNKLCVNQSDWFRDTERLPFADGTNPSILRLKNNQQLEDRIVSKLFGEEAYFLATICMTNSQCAWMDKPKEMEEFLLSTDTKPSTLRTVLLVLNERFETIEETTIHTLIDAQFGRRIKPKPDPVTGKFNTRTFALDDARLFTFEHQIWVSYREGPHFGYDKQVLHPIHLERKDDGQLEAILKASEVETLCCGRNMALLDSVQTGTLQALTWVDPITVVDVGLKKSNRRQLLQSMEETVGELEMYTFSTVTGEDSSLAGGFHERRRLVGERHSDFHGTNGFLVHLPHSQEYLGIGHFHRPPGRDENEYARFGHHYTHAFYTIPDSPPFFLKRLSPELLLPSFQHNNDAEIIQFWSGLELVDDNFLALAYGINDCEGAATYVDLLTVETLLRPVPKGKEVVDLLAPPTSKQH